MAIIPRWEWRTFGSSFGAADDALSKLASGNAPVESTELYLLSTDDANVKIRDGLMDTKVLREVDEAGLERWEPVMKQRFPLSAEDAGRVLEALGIPRPRKMRPAYELDELLEELVWPSGAVKEAEIKKRRARFQVEGCMAELTEVMADGRSTRSVAIESEDASAVVEAVRSVGLDGFVNTSYPRGLRALLDDVPPRYALIDMGTNSVKFHVGERGPDGSWRTVVDRSEMTRLGENLHETGEISDAAIARTADAIAGMVDEARRLGVRAIAAVGTAGMRIARNSDDVIRTIHERTGITIEVILATRKGGSPTSPSRRVWGSSVAASWSSIRAAGARSSPSARVRRCSSGSASTWAPCGTPSGRPLSGQPPCCWARRWRALRSRTFAARTLARRGSRARSEWSPRARP